MRVRARAEGPVALAEEPEARAWAFHSCHPHRSFLTIESTVAERVCWCESVCASLCARVSTYNHSRGPRSLRQTPCDPLSQWHSNFSLDRAFSFFSFFFVFFFFLVIRQECFQQMEFRDAERLFLSVSDREVSFRVSVSIIATRSKIF